MILIRGFDSLQLPHHVVCMMLYQMAPEDHARQLFVGVYGTAGRRVYLAFGLCSEKGLQHGRHYRIFSV